MPKKKDQCAHGAELARPLTDTVHHLPGKNRRVVIRDGVMDIAGLMREIFIEGEVARARGGKPSWEDEDDAPAGPKVEEEKK